MSKRVGIRDVADAAGVSMTTVSHALSGGGVLSDRTREHVRRVARELNYAPNRLASGLRSQRSQTIGFVSDEISTTPFAGRVVLGAQDGASERDLVLMIVNTNADDALEGREIGALLQRQVDGILFARMYHQEVEVPASLAGVPTVLVDAESADKRFSSVVPDEFGAAVTATEHLIGAGHRRIGYVCNQDDILATAGRLRGFRAAMAAHGLPVDESLIVSATPDGPGGRRAALRILEASDAPTALFCFNDRMALGAYQAAALNGLSVPGDLSIVGVDNLEIIAADLLPGLTTVALPHYEMGRWAIDRLHRQIVGDGIEPVQQELVCPLIERDSVAPPR
ncbi:MAG TPA: LacI family DNA-binding transcriptional regulator [Humibacter sp.]|nr:LacI family DNA-binding transcriptional regulator [Humibacter sp.]